MNMIEWAEREVAIACKKEAPDQKDGEWDYGWACYESALKAFKCLMEDGHSGFSIGLTKRILNQLIDGKPLTPIEDTPDIWTSCREEYGEENEEFHRYQCNRMSALFKEVYPDGTIKYKNVDRVEMINIDSPDVVWHNGFITRIVDKLYPLTLPYMPEHRPYRIYCKELLTDRKNGDYDSLGVLYMIKPDGEREDINRYFKEGSENEEHWTEIDAVEWTKREWLHNERERKEAMDHEENTDTV